MQQDLALVSLLGLTHVERNGHHFIDGMSFAPEREQAAFARAHPDLYERSAGPARLRIGDGRLALGLARLPGLCGGRRHGLRGHAADAGGADGHGSRRPSPRKPHDRGAALPDRFESVAALEDFMTRADAGAGRRPRRRRRRHPHSRRRRQDGADARAHGQAGRAGQAHRRRGALLGRGGPRRSSSRPGVETIACDLLDRRAVEALPRLDNVVYMAAMKFGASGNPALTWAMNVHAPAIVAETFAASRIVAFSTGCVYPFVPVDGGGATEDVPAVPPPGDYANSCAGRERMFQHFSARLGTPGRIVRLNYAIDMRYGVLHDIATKVRDGEPIDLAMGHVNVIWQGDANAVALRCLARTTRPTTPINVTGPETISVRWLAEELGRRLDRAPMLTRQRGPRRLGQQCRAHGGRVRRRRACRSRA